MKLHYYLFIFSIFAISSCKKKQDEIASRTPYQIFFDNSDFNGSSEIYKVDSDGNNEQKVTNLSNNGSLSIYSEEPFKYNDRIYFVSNKNGSKERLFSVKTDGTDLISITTNTTHSFHKPFIYQNGQKITFYRSAIISNLYVNEIISSNIDGTNQINLTTTTTDGQCYEPSVSATNSTILYSKVSQIYSMNVNGTSKTKLTNTTTFQFGNPRFSPDGSKIVFDGYQNLNNNQSNEIFIMNSDGSNLIKLTNYSQNGTIDDMITQQPIFTPDGLSIIYVSVESGKSQIYSMNLDGTNKLKITTSPIDKFNPTF